MSWLFLALLAAAVGVLLAAEWPRLAERADRAAYGRSGLPSLPNRAAADSRRCERRSAGTRDRNGSWLAKGPSMVRVLIERWLRPGVEAELVAALREMRRDAVHAAGYISSETLAVKLVFEALPGVEGIEVEIGEEKITLYLRKASV